MVFNLKRIIISLFLFCCVLSSTHGYEKEFIIKNILTDEIIEIEKLDRSLYPSIGDLLLIYSHSSKNVLGYARIINITRDSEIHATVLTHTKSGIVRPLNYLRRINLKTDANEDLIGRLDLIYVDQKNVLPQYRPLVYAGIAQGFTASNLIKKELMFGPSVVAYGVSSRLQASTNLISTIYKVPNGSLKQTLFRNDEYEMAIELGYMYFNNERKSAYISTVYLDMVSNSKFNSYFKIKAFSNKPADDYFYNSEAYDKDVNLEFSFSYGYIFDNWNRIIFGPKIDVNKEKVGGNIGYYYINKEFHALIGFTSNDFSEIKFGRNGYLLNVDFWWRF